MRIRKISQSAAIPGKIVNSPSDSTTETYSCNYINDVSVVVSPTEPTGNNRKKVWMQKGKNLFDSNLLQQGALNGETGLITTSSDAFNKRICVPNHIPLKKGIYTLSYSGLTQCVVYRFNSTKTLYTSDQYQSWYTGNKTFELTEDGYITLAFKNTDGTSITVNDISNVQLEQGQIATSYEEYVEEKIYVKNDNGVYEEFMKKEENTDWMELVTGISYRKIGADVELNIKYIQNIAMANNTWVTIATLPVGYRPKLNIYIPVMIMNTSNVLVYSILAIDPDGKLSFKQATGNNITGTDCRAFSRFSTL